MIPGPLAGDFLRDRQEPAMVGYGNDSWLVAGAAFFLDGVRLFFVLDPSPESEKRRKIRLIRES